jgi:excisionase family DNA binding protein
MKEKLFCIASVAERLVCSRRYVYTLIQDGKLKAVRIGSKNGLRVLQTSLQQFLSLRQVDPSEYDR